MNNKFYLSISMLKDERIKRMMDEFGLAGLGAYVLIRLIIDKYGKTGCNEKIIETEIKSLCRQKRICEIVNNFDLFVVDEHGFVHTCTRTPTPGHRSGHRSGHRCAGEPTKVVYNNHGSENITPTPAPPCVREEEIVGWLTAESNMPWREATMMQSGYGRLLHDHWQEAVHFFLQHAIAQDNIARMYNEHECRQYFTNFARMSTPSGQNLMTHLTALEAQKKDQQRAEEMKNNELWV